MLFSIFAIVMLLYVKVKPNQRFDRVEKTGNQWQLRINAPSIDGKANKHMIEYLAELLELPKSKIILKKGQTTRIKCLEIDEEEKIVLQKLEKASNKE